MKPTNKIIIVLILLFSGVNLFSQEDNSEDLKNDIENKHPLLSDKFTFYGGIYSSTKTIKVGANGSTSNGIIDFNEKFKFDDNEITPFFYFNWRFAKRWSLSAEYFGVKNVNSVAIDENIEWEDFVFNARLDLKAGFSLKMYRVMFGRTISRGLKHELGAGLGVHTLETEIFMEGQAFVSNENTGEGAATEFKRSAINVVAPLPNLGVWCFYAPTNKWLFSGRVDWFGIQVGDYSGTLWNLAAGVNYQFHRNIGVGIKYRYFDFAATVDNENWKGELNLIFQGPLLTVNANF